MGYPMTYQRVINRNGLAKGGYDTRSPVGNMVFGPLLEAEPLERQCTSLRALAETYHRQWAASERAKIALLGDLRRLEEDAIDEGAIVERVAFATSIDRELVAAVIREFMRQ